MREGRLQGLDPSISLNMPADLYEWLLKGGGGLLRMERAQGKSTRAGRRRESE